MSSDDAWEKCWKLWQAKPNYQEDIEQHFREREPLHRLLRKSLKEPECQRLKVLEVACGTAIDAAVLAENPQVCVVAIDRAAEALTVAQKVASSFTRRPHFLRGDASSLCFADETFDVVFSQGFLEHFRDPLPLLREQVRVLKRSGYLIIDVPQKYAGLGLYSIRKQWKIHRGTWPWGWETQFSYLELKRLGKAAGLTPLEVGAYGFDGLFNLLANPHLTIDKWPFLRCSRIAQAFKRLYLRRLQGTNERFWGWLCRRLGHWFLICIVVRFHKKQQCESS